MDVALRAWKPGRHLRDGKKLPSLAAGTAAILVRRIAETRNGPRPKYMEQEGVYRLFRRSAGITELLAKS
jgi:hypothetical protein